MALKQFFFGGGFKHFMETSHTLRKDHRSLSVQLDEFSQASLICGTSSQSKHRLSQPPKDLWILFPSCNLFPQNTHCIFSEYKLLLSFQIFILATCISIIYTLNSFNLFIHSVSSIHSLRPIYKIVTTRQTPNNLEVQNVLEL